MKKVELLAPAGNYESFMGAINAGADAVYLAGEKFGARAYADNFTDEEICRAIDYAHLFRKKVYLTVNTLVKEREMEELYSYLRPFYRCGLDAVIIQDLGVLEFIKRNFPGMQLHVSTQMTVTGEYGAEMLKELGADRIVPARELSLEELKAIKKRTPIEIETFIHGAMCYCYSGQCLFSSILGGRSGNRGRCAQPCRLPYSIAGSRQNGIQKDRRDFGGTEEYPLSLKDMCTLEWIPQLIEAGIDSFKIEGRMKKAEYAAGVTAVYRKSIDGYYASRETGRTEETRVNREDLDKLKQLYIRSGLSDGYYYRQNGREMVTMEQPGYTGADEALLQEIRESFLHSERKLEIAAKAQCRIGRPFMLTLGYGDVSVTLEGAEVQKAQKAPVSKEDIRKQIAKLGGTAFLLADCEVDLQEDAFIPVKELNEIRRRASGALNEALLSGRRHSDAEYSYKSETVGVIKHKNGKALKKVGLDYPKLYCEVNTLEQYEALRTSGKVDRFYIPGEWLFEKQNLDSIYTDKNTEIFLSLPFILRKRDCGYLSRVREILMHPLTDGVLVKNLEALQWLKSIDCGKRITADAGLYVWNHETAAFYADKGISYTAPYELNRAELKELSPPPDEMVVYGFLPLMITANCVYKTYGKCRTKGQNGSELKLLDRMGKEFRVYADCGHCYNIIYNSLPLSLHTQLKTIREWETPCVRLIFTSESMDLAAGTVEYFWNALRDRHHKLDIPYREYTNGHFKRGVE